MKTRKMTHSLLAYGLALLVGGVSTAQAAPGTLSQKPLFLVNNVAPNVLFVHDDSATMQYELSTSGYGTDGTLRGGMDGLTPELVHNQSSCSLIGGIDPDLVRNYLRVLQPNVLSCSETAAEEEWRARLHNINHIYYNPDNRYGPWAGTDNAGDPFDDANVFAAPIDPRDPNSETLDLTVDSAVMNNDGERNYYASGEWSDWCSDNHQTGTCEGWRYYTWEDKNGNGTIDGTINGTEDDELTIHWVKDLPDADKTNFANWFTYHRSREYVAKYAISNNIQSSTARMGFATINATNNQDNWVEMQAANASKDTLLNAVRDTNALTQSTPLVTALGNAGEYYKNSDFFGSGSDDPILPADEGGACQVNNTILLTDGYYSDGDENTTLADVADDYYNDDFRGYDDIQNMTTYTIAFGVEGTLNPNTTDITADDFSWPEPPFSDAEKIDDLWHAAVNGGGQFLSANDSSELLSALNTALGNITDQVRSATSVAISSFRLDDDAKVFFSLFNSIDWSGDLLSNTIAIDANDGSVSLEDDEDDWSAATKLEDENYDTGREIITFDGSGGVPFRWDNGISGDMQTALTAGDADTEIGVARLNYLRGKQNHDTFTFRERSSRLGDIVNSSPVYVGAPAASYPDTDPFGAAGERYFDFWNDNKDRTPVIYVGANDGMLHGFDAGSGEELFAYVPETVFPNLHELTDPDYSHRFFVDETPSVADAYFSKGSPNGSKAWHTILTGGLGAGGRGVYALDITDPTDFYETNADQVALWEFNADDDADLGYTFGRPVIALTEENRWAVIVGNGYNSSDDNNDDGTASLFILYLDADVSDGDGWNQNTDYIKIDTGVGGTGADQNGLSSPTAVDTDGNGFVDRVYAGDLQGNLWAFDLSADNDSNWQVAYGTNGHPEPLFSATIDGTTAQPITAKPSIIRHPSYPTVSDSSPNLMVLFGTGQYLSQNDLSDTETQSFYGVWDRGEARDQDDSALNRTNLVAQTITAGNDADTSITARLTTSNPVNYSDAADRQRFGWYIDLGPDADSLGERVVSNAVVINDTVFFTTYIPARGACDTGGSSWFMFVDAADGSIPDSPVVSINDDRLVNEDDLVSLNDGDTPSAPAGLQVEGTLGSPALDFGTGQNGNNGSTLIYTEAGVENRATNLGDSVLGKRISWRELRDE